jgi:hypothetical protein
VTSGESAGFGVSRAFDVVVGVFGALAALAGLEHGIGALRQGGDRPSVAYESWANTPAFEVLSGEPAMTVIPNLEVTGVLAVTASALLGAWSLWIAWHSSDDSRAGLGLLAISGTLLLVGGGFGPPLIGSFLGVAAVRHARALRAGKPPGRLGRRLAPSWGVWTALGAAGFFGLVPGVPLLSELAGVESAGLVSVLIMAAFAGLGLAIVAGGARDRLWGGDTAPRR